MCGQEVGQVDWAEPEHEVDEETMSSVKILFVRKTNTLNDLILLIQKFAKYYFLLKKI